MSERTPLYESPVVSKVIFEREREVGRAIKALANETGVPSDSWFRVRNRIVESGVAPLIADQIIIDIGRKTAEKADARETQIMTPVASEIQESQNKSESEKLETTQEAPVTKPGNIIMFRTQSNKELGKRLRAATTSETVVTK